MELIKTPIEDVFIIEPKVYHDSRGYFMESYKSDFFKEKFQSINFIQENESKSVLGVLRGLHFQKPPFAQTKLVRVVKGEVIDVVVDLRENSETFGSHLVFTLNETNKKQLLVPRGFAHGFLVTSSEAIFSYKVDQIYSPKFETGIRWNDPKLNIDWGLSNQEIIVSEKDDKLPFFNEFTN